jgi:hypothetical protein
MTKLRLGALTALVVGMAASLLVSVAALPAALSGPAAAGGHRARLTLRGGGKAPEAPAVKLPPRGFLARRFEKFVTDTFESVSKRELDLGALNMAALVWLVSEYGL